MRAFLIDQRDRTAKEVDINPELDELYKVLDCDTIDIVVRKVDGVEFDIVCDDEGLFKQPAVPSACTTQGNPTLVGNLLFCHHNLDGELTECSEDDVIWLDDHLGMLFCNKHIYPIVTGLNY